MAGVNKVILIGNLGADPELRYTNGDTAVGELRIATSRKWKDKSGQTHDKTEWHRVTLWGKTAELAKEHLAKGRQVYIEGRLKTRKWQDRDGRDRYTTEVIAQIMHFLGKREGGGQPQRPQHGEQNYEPPASGPQDFWNDDKIPF